MHEDDSCPACIKAEDNARLHGVPWGIDNLGSLGQLGVPLFVDGGVGAGVPSPARVHANKFVTVTRGVRDAMTRDV